MSDDQDCCLAPPEILAYLDGAVSERRKAEIDQHLDACRLCGAAVEGVAGLEWREGFLKSTDSLLARVRARTAVAAAGRPRLQRFRAAPLYLTLSATLVVTLGTTLLLRPSRDEALFQRYFEPYPSASPVVRGRADHRDASVEREAAVVGLAASRSGCPTANERACGLGLYESGDYQRARAAFDEVLRRQPNDALARFYAGVSRLALGQTREAALDLENVLERGTDELRTPAEWYLALAHLRGRTPSQARPHLEHLVASGGSYEDRARALLSELDQQQR